VESLRVFISSTMRDLQEERTAIDQAISTPPFEARRAETTGARSACSRETVTQAVAECDIYLGIVAGRYGCVPPNESVSVTEMELNEARELGKPILLYLKQVEDRDPRQEDFIKRIGDFEEGYYWREFCDRDVTEQLGHWVREDLTTLLGELVESAYTGAGDAVLAGRCLLALAAISAEEDEPRRAASLLERLGAEQLGDPLVRDYGMERLATLYEDLEAWDLAVDASRERITEYRATPLDEWGHYSQRERHEGERERRIALADRYMRKADCHSHAGEWNDAMDAFDQAAEQYRKAGEEAQRKGALASLAWVCERAGDSWLDREQPDAAISYYRQALRIHEELGSHSDWGRLMYGLGLVYLRQGRIAEARDQFEGAIPHHRTAQRHDSMAAAADRLMEVYSDNPHIAGGTDLLFSIGVTYVAAGYCANALEALEECRRVSRDGRDHDTHGKAALLMADLREKEAVTYRRAWDEYKREESGLRAVQLYAEAEQLLDEAARSFDQSGNRSGRRRTKSRIERVSKAIRDLEDELAPLVQATAA